MSIRQGGDIIHRANFERRFYEVDTYLKELTDKDPHGAIQAARDLTPDGILDPDSVDAIASGTLVDAGVVARDAKAVEEGVSILERLAAASPERADIQYCLANGLSAQADFDATDYPQWYLSTADIRRRAKRLYQSVASNQSAPLYLRAEAHTNLGNLLLHAYRLVEAYDCYTRALHCDPTNGIALTGAASVLITMAESGTGDAKVLLSVASKYLRQAKENPGRIRELAGEKAYQLLSTLLNIDINAGELPELSAASDYQRFVAEHRLSLSPTLEGLDLSISRWDSLRLGSVTVHISDGAGVPPIFAMFNVLKAEFLSARYLAYSALNDTIPDSGKYSDTLDYATYGITSSLLTLAQRTCLDILDKVAVAASEYLKLPGDPDRISFTTRWFDDRKAGIPVAWKPEVRDAIAKGNTALIAISEVSGDIKAGGFLHEKRAIRNASTHRFTVLHDLGATPSRISNYVDHYAFDGFVAQLIETLQLTRAVLHYFVEMVALNEHLSYHDGSFKGELFVPDHDWVRGQKA